MDRIERKGEEVLQWLAELRHGIKQCSGYDVRFGGTLSMRNSCYEIMKCLVHFGDAFRRLHGFWSKGDADQIRAIQRSFPSQFLEEGTFRESIEQAAARVPYLAALCQTIESRLCSVVADRKKVLQEIGIRPYANIESCLAEVARSLDVGRVLVREEVSPDESGFRQPLGACLYSYGRLPRDIQLHKDVAVAPELVIELHSVGANWRDVRRRVDQALDSGTLMFCFLAPESKALYVHSDDHPPLVLTADQYLAVPQLHPSFRVPVRSMLEGGSTDPPSDN